MTHPSTPAAARPHVLLLMSEGTFDLQFHAEQVDRLRALAEVGEPAAARRPGHPAGEGAAGRGRGASSPRGAHRRSPPSAPRRRAPLRAILHAAGTVRGLVPDEVWARGMLVTNAAAENARPVAEYTLAAIILAGKRAPFLAAEARTRRDDWSFLGERGVLSNRDRTIGIVGWSRIGRAGRSGSTSWARRASSSRTRRSTAAAWSGTGARLVDLLDELLRRSRHRHPARPRAARDAPPHRRRASWRSCPTARR